MRHTVHIPSNGLKIAAHLYLPDDLKTGERRAAIVVSHSRGGAQEQTAGLYAEKLCGAGFIALALDAACRGDSPGEPPPVDDSFARSDDIKCAVTYLTTLEAVHAGRIGALGLCASGGYVPHAAATERRIKAVVCISAADRDPLVREGQGGRGNCCEEALAQMLETAGRPPAAQAPAALAHLKHMMAQTTAEVMLETHCVCAEGADSYRARRTQPPGSQSLHGFPSKVEKIAACSSFDLLHLISPRPLLMIAGAEADTLYFSALAIGRAREPKELYLIEGATQIDLYDRPECVDLAVMKMRLFFVANLA